MRWRTTLPSIIVVLLAMAMSGSALALAQTPATGLTVVGYGQASAAADSASLYLFIGDTNFYGPTVPNPNATPGAEERAALEPVIASLGDVGVSDADIEVSVAPYIQDVYTQFGPASGVVRVNVPDPSPDRLTEIIDAATVGAAQEQLLVGSISVVYDVEDCDALQREARQAAIADARGQADIQAELLDVTVGDLLASRDLSAGMESAFWFGGFPPGGCSPFELTGSPFLAGIPQSFDPSVPAEVTVYAAVELSFSMSGDSAATPTG